MRWISKTLTRVSYLRLNIFIGIIDFDSELSEFSISRPENRSGRGKRNRFLDRISGSVAYRTCNAGNGSELLATLIPLFSFMLKGDQIDVFTLEIVSSILRSRSTRDGVAVAVARLRLCLCLILLLLRHRNPNPKRHGRRSPDSGPPRRHRRVDPSVTTLLSPVPTPRHLPVVARPPHPARPLPSPPQAPPPLPPPPRPLSR